MQANTGLSALSGLVGKAIYLLDTFTDVNGTALTAHTMDVGPGWTLLEGTTFPIQANKAAGSQGVDHAIADAGQTQVIASVDWVPTTPELAAAFQAGLSTRVTDATHYFVIVLQGDGTFTIFENAAGFVARASAATGALTAGNTYTLALSWVGNTLTATVNGGNALSYTSANNQAASKHGIRIASDNVNLISLDNFKVTSP